jgi:hypothetical protein
VPRAVGAYFQRFGGSVDRQAQYLATGSYAVRDCLRFGCRVVSQEGVDGGVSVAGSIRFWNIEEYARGEP